MTSLFRHIRQSVTLFFLAVLCFCAGSAIAQISTTAPPQIVPVSAGNEGNWGLSFQQEGNFTLTMPPRRRKRSSI